MNDLAIYFIVWSILGLAFCVFFAEPHKAPIRPAYVTVLELIVSGPLVWIIAIGYVIRAYMH